MKRYIRYHKTNSKFNFLLAGTKFYPVRKYGFYMTRYDPIIYLLEFSEEVSEITVFNENKVIVSDNRDYVKLKENDVIRITYTNGNRCALRLTKDSHGFYNFNYIL